MRISKRACRKGAADGMVHPVCGASAFPCRGPPSGDESALPPVMHAFMPGALPGETHPPKDLLNRIKTPPPREDGEAAAAAAAAIAHFA